LIQTTAIEYVFFNPLYLVQ